MSSTTQNSKRSGSGDQLSAARLNSLGLTGEQSEALLTHMDARSPDQASARRGSARLAYRRPSVPLFIEQPGGGTTGVKVIGRNISKGGLSFLHSAYLHVGTRCVVILKHNIKGDVPVRARITRCRHVERNVHEIGMRFDASIDVLEYVVADTMSGVFTCENVEPEKLEGDLLLVASQPIDKLLVSNHLEATKLRAYEAATLEDALKQHLDTLDIIIADYDLGEKTAVDLLRELKARHCRVPVLVMSADSSTPLRESLRNAGASACLIKPVEKAVMLRALAEFMMGGGGGDARGPLYSTLPADSPLAAVVPMFASESTVAAAELEALLSGEDYVRASAVVSRVLSGARTAGFAAVAEVADQAVKALSASMSVSEANAQLASLIGALRRIRLKKAA